MSETIRLNLSPAEQQTLSRQAKNLGMTRHAYARHLLFGRNGPGDITLTPAFYREAVEACARTVGLPRPQVEALVSVVFNQLHQAQQVDP